MREDGVREGPIFTTEQIYKMHINNSAIKHTVAATQIPTPLH